MIRISPFLPRWCAWPRHRRQPLPAGLDKQNAIVVDTTKGRIVFKPNRSGAPAPPSGSKLLAREGYYNNVRSTA